MFCPSYAIDHVMVEPVSAVTTVASTLAAKAKSDGLIKRMLGPTADAMGSDLANWYDNRPNRIAQIAESAERKLGHSLNEEGSVPSRVVALILGEGSYCDDRIMVEYLGGVLASSRTTDGRDDRGSRWVGTVTSLSAYDIRLHYLLYGAAMDWYLSKGLVINWGDMESHPVSDVAVVFNADDIVRSMEFSGSEIPNEILPESLFALDSEDLIADWYVLPSAEFAKRALRIPWDAALGFRPTPKGIQLFMWAQGRGSIWGSFGQDTVDLSAIDCPLPKCLSLNDAKTFDQPVATDGSGSVEI